MRYDEAVQIGDTYLLAYIGTLYELESYTIRLLNAHMGGRNVVYSCEKTGNEAKILRIAFLPDRSREDFLGEVEYVRYLSEHGGSVADVIASRSGNLVEEVTYGQHTFFVCLFKKAPGKMLVENQYRYREGIPISEYYYNCGKVLGKLHQIAKGYAPVHRRYSFFDKYTADYIEKLLPDSMPSLKAKLIQLIRTLEGLDQNAESFGLVHFDYSDGNYSIDFETGQITVYDFDNACYCWYLFDLAEQWTHGVGWIQSEPDPRIRKQFMDDYFATIVAGYRSGTRIDDAMLAMLPLFIQVTLMERIVDEFEVARNNGEGIEYDEELTHCIHCLENDIPYLGLLHERATIPPDEA